MKKCLRVWFLIALLAAAPAALAQAEFSIAQIQGSSNVSPHAGKRVRASGVVTARVRTGFFIQTPDELADKDPLTSEGIFVFSGGREAPPAEAVPGNLVSLTGTVEEFRRDNEPFVLTLTEIVFESGRDKISVISKNNKLPAPIALKIEHFTANSFDQLERFEGMRVTAAEVLVVSPTGGRTDNNTGRIVSDGAFAAVLKGIRRPHREPGIDIRELLISEESSRMKELAPKMPIFDSNPEAFRVDTDEQMWTRNMSANGSAQIPPITSSADGFGTAIDVAAGTRAANISGVMHYAFGRFTIFTDPDKTPKILSAIRPAPLRSTAERQFSVAAMNLENFFDDVDDPKFKEPVTDTAVFESKMAKISIGIRGFLHMPDVIGVVEAENLSGLDRLAAKINADAKAAGLPDPKYRAFLEDGNDGRGINNGFLIKTSRVTVLETKQYGKNERYEHPKTGQKIYLNDRPPFMIRVSIDDEKTGKPFEFTVIVNHLKSYLGYSDPRQSDNVRLKKRLQAEYLAGLVNERQNTDPAERIIVLGDLNSYHFSDGILDMVGTIKGEPAGKDTVLFASEDLVEPNLINLVDIIHEQQRYSYVFDASAQTLDHILISQTLKAYIKGFGFARINADFPKIFTNDANRVERFSDHDPAVAYFSLGE